MATDTLKSAYLNPSANASGAVDLSAPDLTRHPPRSPRVRLGGYAHLPRMIDKARASLIGKNGDFHYNCPIDQMFFGFTGLNPDAFLAQVKAGSTDGELLAYVNENAKPKRQLHEVVAWSQWYESLSPTKVQQREYFNEVLKKIAPAREDVMTWCDWLDLDDFVTYGGKA